MDKIRPFVLHRHEILQVSWKAFGERVEIGILYSQATSFKVDETGAEAAAITAGGNFATATPTEPEVIEINVDHPFYFSINEYSTGACIISGRITQL